MILAINSNTGVPMFPQDQIMMVPDIRRLYSTHGLHGIYYAILFGWVGSPYQSQTDEEQRDILAYDAVKVTELYDAAKGKIVKPDKIHRQMYLNPFFPRAIEAINLLAPVPALELRAYYIRQMEEWKSFVNKKRLDPNKDAAEIEKTLKSKTEVIKQIGTLNKAVTDIDQEIKAAMQIEKVVTMDLLIQSLTGNG